MDDMNFLLYREQEELLLAQTSRNRDKSELHFAVALCYARRISEHRHPYRSGQASGRCAFDPAPYGGHR